MIFYINFKQSERNLLLPRAANWQSEWHQRCCQLLVPGPQSRSSAPIQSLLLQFGQLVLEEQYWL